MSFNNLYMHILYAYHPVTLTKFLCVTLFSRLSSDA